MKHVKLAMADVGTYGRLLFRAYNAQTRAGLVYYEADCDLTQDISLTGRNLYQ